MRCPCQGSLAVWPDQMTLLALLSHGGFRFSAEIISFAAWLYFRLPLSLHHVDEVLAARGIVYQP